MAYSKEQIKQACIQIGKLRLQFDNLGESVKTSTERWVNNKTIKDKMNKIAQEHSLC